MMKRNTALQVAFIIHMLMCIKHINIYLYVCECVQIGCSFNVLHHCEFYICIDFMKALCNDHHHRSSQLVLWTFMQRIH